MGEDSGCRASPKLCGRARQMTTGSGYCERVSRRERRGSWKKRFVLRQGAEERSTPKRAKGSSSREWFHTAAVTTGGERSWISTAVSLSTTTIGPPHLGQRQRSLKSSLEEADSSGASSLREHHVAFSHAPCERNTL